MLSVVTVVTRSWWRTVIVVSAWALALTATALGWISRDVPTPPELSLGSKVVELIFPIASLSLIFVGVLTTTRFPRHPVAWLFITMGFSVEWMSVAQNYGLYAMSVVPEQVPGGDIALWASTWLWAPASSGITLLFLLFPDGHVPSPRWRPVLWLTVGSAIVAFLQTVFAPHEAAISTFWTMSWILTTILALAAIVMRFRRAAREERQQLKWFAYPSGIATVVFVISALLWETPEIGPVFAGAAALAVLLIPIGAAIAILKYRLYDIDVLFRRTVVYTMTTVSVALLFIASVFILQGLLQAVTGGSEIAVAVATLASLALVRPLLTTVQLEVDRRFYRARYDAQRTLDSFSARVRDAVDLDALADDLLGVVNQTMQPARTSLWLRSRSVGGQSARRADRP